MAEKEKVEGRKKPSYQLAMEEKWLKWTGIKDDEVFEALNDFSGDLFLEMRKLTAKICTECESQKLPDEFKEMAKEMIDEAWKNIIDHQKIGLDKLCIVIKSYIKE